MAERKLTDERKLKGEAEKMIDREDVRPARTTSQAVESVPEHIHEGSDVSIGPIAKFLAVLFVGIGVTHLILWGLFEMLEARAEKSDKPLSPVADTVRKFSEPALQENPYLDLAAFRASQDSAMNRYEWVDTAARIARVPVGVAMEMIARQGLPTRAQVGGEERRDTLTLHKESGTTRDSLRRTAP